MVLLTATATRGSYNADNFLEINQLEKNTGAGTDYAVGLVLYQDPADDKYKTAPTTNAFAPFAVAVNKKSATTDTKLEGLVSGHVILEADGAIAPGNYVVVSAATAGTVQEYAVTGSPTAGTASTELRRIVGKYIGKANGNEKDGVTQTAAADGDLIWVKIGVF